ncbi:hypothetical protein HMPREF0580_0730 [Mobiluncus mulieris ATCC 35239]|uniref:Uncharacterized protein n=1 Tax=Mobiluncus mulieris ATCC 35239 TaxID=871571 RepID=E0QPB5_9ACTO|nr:hypothetical protein HMPREF0580_0730 [Mobiluncus mulieris ATCC 35239]
MVKAPGATGALRKGYPDDHPHPDTDFLTSFDSSSNPDKGEAVE